MGRSAEAFTVALIGPDGAGKTTLAQRLEHELPMPACYLYMGINADASNRMLPTTRLVRAIKRRRGAPADTGGPPDPASVTKPKPKGALKRARGAARSTLRLANQLAEESYRHLLARKHVKRGSIVLFDRHFFADYYAYDIANDAARPLSRRVHGWALQRLYRKPDLVVYLDAPAEVLLERKGEGTLEALERRRGDYLELARVTPNFEIVDAGRPLDEVAGEIVRVISEFSRRRGAT
jgi:thymidylate kinase